MGKAIRSKADVFNLYKEHGSFVKVAELLGVSRQRVQQILKGFEPYKKYVEQKKAADLTDTELFESYLEVKSIDRLCEKYKISSWTAATRLRQMQAFNELDRTEIRRNASTKHGASGTPTYESWRSAKTLCYSSNHPSYPQCGGKGIKMCDRWLESFENFLADMGERPKGAMLSRIDESKDYEPGNCEWSYFNKRAKSIKVGSCRISRNRAEKLLGLPPRTIRRRLDKGLPPLTQDEIDILKDKLAEIL